MNTQGQAVNSEQEEFTAFLINILQPSSKEDFEKKIMSLSEDDIKELYRQFKQAKNQTVMAKNGLKFDILSNYRGRCPEGTEIFMDGGCIKCRDKKNKIKIKQDGGEMKKRFEMGPGDSDSANKARPNKLQKKAFKDTKKERFCSGGRASKYQQGGGFRILPAPDVEQIKPSEVLINRYKNNYINQYGEPSTASTTVYTDTRNPETQAVVTKNSNDIFPVEAGYQGPNGYQMTYPTNPQVSNEERLTNQARSVAREYKPDGRMAAAGMDRYIPVDVARQNAAPVKSRFNILPMPEVDATVNVNEVKNRLFPNLAASTTQPAPVRRYNTTPAVNGASIHQGIANQAPAMQLAPMNHQSISRIDAIKNRFARKSKRLENRQQRQNNRLARKTARVQRRFN